MPIDFLDLLADDGWAPATVVPEGATPPADAAAVVDGARRSTGIDASFGLHGVRLPSGYRGPERRHDQPLLMIVFDGVVEVRSRDEGGPAEQRVGPGEFCVIDEGTVHSISAGSDGATYTECWPQDVDGARTEWSPGDAAGEDGADR